MSSNSLNDLSTKYLIERSSSQDDGSQQSYGYSDSTLSAANKSSPESTAKNSASAAGEIRMKISPISTAANSLDEKIESSTELDDIETSTKHLQTESGSFNSHTQSNYNKKIDSDSNRTIEEQLNEDLYLPLAEEQDANFNACLHDTFCKKNRLRINNKDPIESLVSATLAFREASHNQCDLLRAQTSAINRLATAIEDQNVMMSRFHNVVQRNSTRNLQEINNHSRED